MFGFTKTLRNGIVLMDGQGSKELSMTIELITPELAKEYLTRNKNCRLISESHVKEYMSALVNGTFMLTHQGIAFDLEGNLVDGQHRLTAIVRTGIPARMVVFRNVNNIEVVDCGQSRNLATRLQESNKTAAICNVLISLYNRDFSSSVHQARFLLDHEMGKKIIFASDLCSRLNRRVIGSAAFGAAVAYVTHFDLSSVEYVENMITGLQKALTEILPPIGKSLFRQIATDHASFNLRTSKAYAFARITKALSRENANVSRLGVSTQEQNIIIDDFRQRMSSVFSGVAKLHN